MAKTDTAPTNAAEVIAQEPTGALSAPNVTPEPNIEEHPVVVDLRAQLAAAATDNESSLANANAEIEKLKAQLAAIKSNMGAALTEDDDGNYTVRLVRNLLVNPGLDDAKAEDGTPRSPYTLVKGLNVGVPKWVAESWIVKNSLEASPEDEK